MRQYRWWLVLLVLSLSLVGSMSMPSVTTAGAASAVCTIRISGNGDVLAVFSSPPMNFNVAVSVPADNDVVVPVLCEDLPGSLGLGVANQQNDGAVTVTVIVSDKDGVPFCDKGSFTIAPGGARGLTFGSCLAP